MLGFERSKDWFACAFRYAKRQTQIRTTANTLINQVLVLSKKKRVLSLYVRSAVKSKLTQNSRKSDFYSLTPNKKGRMNDPQRK